MGDKPSPFTIAWSHAHNKVTVVPRAAASFFSFPVTQGQPQWENIEQPLYHLNIQVKEAKEFPNNAGKTDPFIKLYYKDDLYPQKTQTIDNTLTPQWFQNFTFPFINLDYPLIIRLVDDNYIKNSETIEELKYYL